MCGLCSDNLEQSFTFIANCQKKTLIISCKIAIIAKNRDNFGLLSFDWDNKKDNLRNYDNKLVQSEFWLVFTKVKLALIIYDLSLDFIQC